MRVELYTDPGEDKDSILSGFAKWLESLPEVRKNLPGQIVGADNVRWKIPSVSEVVFLCFDNEEKNMCLPVKGGFTFVSVNNIVRALHFGRKAVFYFKDGTSHEFNASLKDLNEVFSKYGYIFSRVNRTEFINLTYTYRICGRECILKDGYRTTLSKAYIPAVRKKCCELCVSGKMKEIGKTNKGSRGRRVKEFQSRF